MPDLFGEDAASQAPQPALHAAHKRSPAKPEAKPAADARHWPAIRASLLANPHWVRDDAALVEALGLRHAATNVVEFGPAALARLEAAREREITARQELESLARANFAAQAHTHALVVDILEARNNAELARVIDVGARERFGLSAGAVLVEGPGPTPAGWRALPSGFIDLLLGGHGLAQLGPVVAREELFGPEAQVESMALVRMAVWSPARHGLLAFASPEPEGFRPEMGAELIAFVARVVERTAERWPPR